MKVFKGILAGLGAVAMIVAIVMLLRISWNLQGILGSANRYTPAGEQQWGSPVQDVILTTGIALLSGLLLGLALGMPRRTSSSVREEAIASYQAKGLSGEQAEQPQPTLIDRPNPTDS